MQSKPFTFVAVVCMALTLSTLSAVAQDAAMTGPGPVASAVQAYQAEFQAARDAGQWPSAEQRGEMVDKALGGMAIGELPLDQLDELSNGLPLVFGQARGEADAALAAFAEAPDAQGARAAAIRLRLISSGTTPQDRAAMIKAVLTHPGLGEALTQGFATEPFSSLGWLPDDVLMSLHGDFIATEGLVDASMPAGYFARMGGALFTFANAADAQALEAQEPLRAKLVEAIDAKLAGGDLPENDAKTLTDTRGRLDGAFARGMLVGHTAPELHFAWWRNPNDPNESYTKLSDIKGKVIVLDFWATWCGPCVGSFPNVRELQAHYDGYDVVIVGITSLQGAHYTGDERGKIDTADDPAKETGLMPEFMAAKDVTWRVAFADEPVFNPDYGVNGIPHVAIIDANGVVRFRGLHPAMPMEDKTSKIDQLLAEAGKPVPAAPVETDKPETAETAPQGGE